MYRMHPGFRLLVQTERRINRRKRHRALTAKMVAFIGVTAIPVTAVALLTFAIRILSN